MSSRVNMSVGEQIAPLLEAYGVETVFGIPGVHNVEFYRGLGRTGIRHVLPRHEQGAGFMADGYARVTGKPGVCFLISGPGVTNVLTPMGEAHADSVPMLVLASVLQREDMGRMIGRLHEITDQRAAAATVSTYAATAFDAASVPQHVARALTRMTAERPAPNYLEVPIDVLTGPAEDSWKPHRPTPRPAPDAARIAEAANLLTNAKRPLIITGGGAAGASADIREIAETLSALVIPTFAGKGTVPDDHPLSAGACLPHKAGQSLLAEADVILVVGSELAEGDFYGEPRPHMDGMMIRVDLDADRLADSGADALPIQADSVLAMAALKDALGSNTAQQNAAWNADKAAAIRAAAVANEVGIRADHHRPILSILREELPRNAVISADMTQIAYSGDEIFPCYEPRSWLHPTGYGTLGYGLPAAIGAALGAPERKAVALVGDYGFQYTLNELGVAAELGLDLIVLLWNNSALGEIRDDMIRKDIPPMAVEQTNPDFQMLAASYGYGTSKPESLDDFRAVLKEALEKGGPQLIEMTPEAVK